MAKVKIGNKKDAAPAKSNAAIPDSIQAALALRDGKLQALQAAIKKSYGDDLLTKASEVKERAILRISSGSFALDAALGGGWPRGRISLIWGDQSGGKTYDMLKMIAEAQKLDLVTNKFLWEVENPVPFKIAYVDVEGAFDFSWATTVGVDLSLLDYMRPDSAEQAGNMVENLFSSRVYDIVVIDSIAAMCPEKEIEGDVEDHHVGKAAVMINRMIKKIQAQMNVIYQENPRLVPTCFLINQKRDKITMFGHPRVKPGGKAQDFYTSVEVYKTAGKMTYYDPKEMTMPKTKELNFEIIKNKTSPAQIHGSYELAVVDDPDGAFDQGQLLEQKAIMNYAERAGLFGKAEKGGWTLCGETYRVQGDIEAQAFQDPDKLSQVKRAILAKLFPKAFEHVLEETQGGESVQAVS